MQAHAAHDSRQLFFHKAFGKSWRKKVLRMMCRTRLRRQLFVVVFQIHWNFHSCAQMAWALQATSAHSSHKCTSLQHAVWYAALPTCNGHFCFHIFNFLAALSPCPTETHHQYFSISQAQEKVLVHIRIGQVRWSVFV